MHHTWKLLTIIFIVAIIGLGVAAANNPNLKARFDALLRGTLGEAGQTQNETK